MSDRGVVRVAQLTFGSAGTQATLLGSNTATSNALRMSKDDYTVQYSNTTTGTSIAGGQVVLQASNDSLVWLPVGTAAATSTNASTSSTVNGASFSVTSKYAYTRGVVISTGTGVCSVYVAS